MNSIDLRKHLIEQLKLEQSNESKFMGAFRDRLSEAQQSMLLMNEENKPSIDLVSNSLNSDANLNTQLIEALYPYIKDYSKIDVVLSDPELDEELKKAILYNFKTEIEPRLENIKNKRITIDEFQNYLKNMAKDLLANETVFTTAKNTNAKTWSDISVSTAEGRQQFVANVIPILTADNISKITTSREVELNISNPDKLTKKDMINLIKEYAKIDQNATTLYVSIKVALVDKHKKSMPINIKPSGFLKPQIIEPLEKLYKPELQDVLETYLDEIKTYSIQLNNIDMNSLYNNINKVYRMRQKTLDPTISTSISSTVPLSLPTQSSAQPPALQPTQQINTQQPTSPPPKPPKPSPAKQPAIAQPDTAQPDTAPPTTAQLPSNTMTTRSRSKATGSTKTTGSGIELIHQNVNNKYYVDRSKLKRNVLEIRYVKNRHLIPVKPHVISAKFRNIVEKALSGNQFNPKNTYDLTPKEKHLLITVAPYLNISRDDIDDDDEYHDRFEVIRGSILAGNNNESIKKEARKYLLYAYNTGQINRLTYTNMIEELDL